MKALRIALSIPFEIVALILYGLLAVVAYSAAWVAGDLK